MNTKIKILQKGQYLHEHNRNFIEITQFLKVEQDKKQVVILRIINNLDYRVTSLKFKLVQYDGQGNIIAQAIHNLAKLNLKPKKLTALDRGISVKKECVDFVIEFISAKSLDYEYIPKGDDVSVYYLKPKTDANPLSGPISPPKIRRIHAYNTTKIMVASILSLIFIALITFLVIYSNYTKDKDGMSIWLKIAIDVWDFIKETAIIVANAIKTFFVEIMPKVLKAVWQAIVWFFTTGLPIGLDVTWQSLKWFFGTGVPIAFNTIWQGLKWFFGLGLPAFFKAIGSFFKSIF